MKKYVCKIIQFFFVPIIICSQTLNIHKIDGSVYNIAINDIDSITFNSSIVSYGIPCPGIPTVTYEGKTYNTVLIGAQCWLKENLDLGTMILGESDVTENGIIEKYCYDDDINNCAIYGGLYQWYEAMKYSSVEGSQGICPNDWHIPTITELETLGATVNDSANALKAIGQGGTVAGTDGTGTNTSGFSLLLSGARFIPNNNFSELSVGSFLWSSTEKDGSHSKNILISYGNNGIGFTYSGNSYGYSIRCLKD